MGGFLFPFWKSILIPADNEKKSILRICGRGSVQNICGRGSVQNIRAQSIQTWSIYTSWRKKRVHLAVYSKIRNQLNTPSGLLWCAAAVLNAGSLNWCPPTVLKVASLMFVPLASLSTFAIRGKFTKILIVSLGRDKRKLKKTAWWK